MPEVHSKLNAALSRISTAVMNDHLVEAREIHAECIGLIDDVYGNTTVIPDPPEAAPAAADEMTFEFKLNKLKKKQLDAYAKSNDVEVDPGDQTKDHVVGKILAAYNGDSEAEQDAWCDPLEYVPPGADEPTFEEKLNKLKKKQLDAYAEFNEIELDAGDKTKASVVEKILVVYNDADETEQSEWTDPLSTDEYMD